MVNDIENFELKDGGMKFKYWTSMSPAYYIHDYWDHFHTEYELYLLLDGDIEFQIEQERYIINPLDIILIRPGQHHNVVIKSPAVYRRIVLRFGSSDIPASLEHQIKALPEVFSIKGLKVEHDYETFLDLIQTTNRNCLVTALKSQMIVILCRLCSTVDHEKKAHYISAELEQAIKVIENNLSSIQTEEDICKKLNRSQSSLRKLFIRNLQTPVMTYVRTKKCMKAHELLLTGLAPKQIYKDCGFNYYSTFYRAYIKTYGHSPLKV